MNQQNSQLSHYDIMTEEWEEIFQAISHGQYSWACVLIIYAVGQHPLAYIPYRTYSRLIKKNTIPSVIQSRINEHKNDNFISVQTDLLELNQ